MSEWVELKAADGHELGAYVAKPKGEPLGAIIVIQEIFGVNQSIRSVADEYARHDFVAIAPALFDRFGKSIELGYTGEDLKKAYELYGKLNPDTQLLDVAAAAQHVAGTGKGTGVIGFCYGGLLTWLSATRAKSLKMDLKAAVGFYAGGIGKFAAEATLLPGAAALWRGRRPHRQGPDRRRPRRASRRRDLSLRGRRARFRQRSACQLCARRLQAGP